MSAYDLHLNFLSVTGEFPLFDVFRLFGGASPDGWLCSCSEVCKPQSAIADIFKTSTLVTLVVERVLVQISKKVGRQIHGLIQGLPANHILNNSPRDYV